MPKRKQPKPVQIALPKSMMVSLALVVGFASGYLYYDQNLPQVFSVEDKTPTYNVCFSPEGQCEKLAIHAINSAKSELLVQSYSFTSKPIANALIQAHKRGVKVSLLFDQSQLKAPYSQVQRLKQNGIQTKVDCVEGIAHNKVIIIDGERLVTGSYNFSKSANSRNAENMIYINNPDLARTYKQKWIERYR